MCWAALSLWKNSPPDGASQQTALCSPDTASPTSHTAFISGSPTVNKPSWIDKHTYISDRGPKRSPAQCCVLFLQHSNQNSQAIRQAGCFSKQIKHSSNTNVQSEGGISGWSASPYALKPLQQIKSDHFHKFSYVKSRTYSNKYISEISIYIFHFW